MRTIIILFLSFYQVDMAFAEDPATTNANIIQQHLEKMSKLSVFAMRMPPRLVHSFQHPMVTEQPAPLSCDVTVQSNRGNSSYEYNCDAIKTLKTETLAVAAN